MLRSYILETKFEFLKHLRMPSYALPTLLAPIMFYVFFGIAMGSQIAGGAHLSRYLLATYGAFGVMGASLFSFGVGIALERSNGWLMIKRASPMPPFAYFLARGIVAAAFGALIVMGLTVLATVFAHVHLTVATWFALFGVLVAGTIPFCALGLAVGAAAPPNSAPAIVNAIYLPMGFLAGLWIPLEVLPSALRVVAPVFPAYHLGQLALAAIGAAPVAGWWIHALVLAAYAAAGFWIAAIAFRRGEDRSYA
jgi:ABC-2 type transport system permease protein